MTKDDNYVNYYYLDACATTPLHPQVIEKINHIQSNFWGNPSSLHTIGIQAAEVLERSRLQLSAKLKCGLDEIIFTSGATESINLAIKGLTGNLNPGRIVISNVEHPATIAAAESLKSIGWDVKYWEVDNKGMIRLDLLEEYLSPPTKVVSLIWGQSEIGTVQPVKIVGEQCRNRNIIFHLDATQVLPHGYFECEDFNFDLLSASSHKIQGPKGIGLLICKSHIQKDITPINQGGNQQNLLRSGTEPVNLIAGFTKAIELLTDKIKIKDTSTLFPSSKVSLMTDQLGYELSLLPNLIRIGHLLERIPNHLSYIVVDNNSNPINGRFLVRELSKRGIYVSSGTACSSSNEINKTVLQSINIKNDLQNSLLRISLGPWISKRDLNTIKKRIKDTIYYISRSDLA